MFELGRKLWLMKRRLAPPEEVAGIEITETFGRLLLLDSVTLNVITEAEAPMPAGSIVDGRVNSIANLEAAFKQLKASAGAAFSYYPAAILTLPPELFFTHVLTLPDIPEKNFDEAVRLNTIQISPIKLADAYFDWQNLGANLETFEREFFIVLAARDIIDPYLEAARRAGIDIIAVEPWSLGLARVFLQFASAPDKRLPFLINRISSDGIDSAIVKESKLLFSHFSFWRDMPETHGGKLDADMFRVLSRRSIAKVSSFFSTRHKSSLSHAVFFTPFFQNELTSILRDEFGMKVAGYRLPTFRGSAIDENRVGALGAALRGIISRADDTIVSLMPVGTEELFRRKQVGVYTAFWGKIFGIVMVFFTLVFGAVFLLADTMRRYATEALEIQRRTDIAVIATDLAQRAKEFNDVVNRVRVAEGNEEVFAEELRAIADAMDGVKITHFSIFGDARQLRLTAIATDRARAGTFKSRLEATGKFSQLDLPLALVRSVPEGVEFTITAMIP